MFFPDSSDKSVLFFQTIICFVLSIRFKMLQSFFVNPGIGVPFASKTSTSNFPFKQIIAVNGNRVSNKMPFFGSGLHGYKAVTT